MYAIVSTGGKQYKVEKGDVIAVEKLDVADGEEISLDVLCIADDGKVVVDADALAAAKVTAQVVEQFKGEKALVFKFKKRKGYKKLRGHRQQLTRVKITDIAL
ncbi:MAG: 50S ribosomal protein L21 [Coriobacteriales bacterium]|nr:50S ribosomal protein L21 [Coriobacteriales bacterium]MBQ6586441.1 50S ribosomal protein L21 [Coriobacteriales bacterium]